MRLLTINNLCSKCFCDIRNSPANCSQAYDPPGFATDLRKMLCKMRKYCIIDVTLFFYIIIVITYLFQQIEKHCKSVLCHRFCRIASYISPCNSSFFC